jgi:alkylation response protein AidB-like acyl-CoA dehydrogenase
MCLTEPHCGTDLGLLKTQARSGECGRDSYSITGTKIFITAGEHDFTDNIVHLVLAQACPMRPRPVPKAFRCSSPRRCKRRRATAWWANATRCAAARIEHKMGIHGFGRPA